MRTRQPTRTAATLVAAVLLAACGPAAGPVDGDDPTEPVASAGDDRDERIAEVLAARALLAESVPAVVEAADGYVEGLRGVRNTEVASSERRAAAAAALPTTALDGAEAALEGVDLEGDGPDVAAATAAVDAMLATVGEVRDLVAAEVDELRALADFDAELADLVDVWDAPGSRTPRRAQLDEAATEATALAEQARSAEPTVSCLDVWTHRAEAADVVAERSAQLRDLVAGSTGEEYDQARDEWRDDPTGLGTPPAELDASGMDCWDEGSPAPGAVTRLRELAADVQAALSPEDLEG